MKYDIKPAYMEELFSMIETIAATGWCKGAIARNHKGRECAIDYEVDDEDIASYSLDGAINRAIIVLSTEEELDALALRMVTQARFIKAGRDVDPTFTTITEWNDRKSTTREDMLKLIERASNVRP